MEENRTIINDTEPEKAEPEITEPVKTAYPEKKGRKKGALKIIAAFAAGFAACLAVFAIALYPAGLGKIISQDDYDFYQQLNERYGKYNDIMNMIDKDPLVKEVPAAVSEESIKEMVKNLGDPYGNTIRLKSTKNSRGILMQIM